MAEIENLKNFDFYQFFKIKIFYENKNPGTQNDSFLTLKTMEILIFSNLYYNFLVSFDTHMSSLPVIFKSRIWIIQKMFFQISVLNFVFFAQNYYVLPEKFSVIMCWQLFILPTKLFRGYLLYLMRRKMATLNPRYKESFFFNFLSMQQKTSKQCHFQSHLVNLVKVKLFQLILKEKC